MSAEATCRCICHAFGDERLYCEHRGCCNAWAKGYRDASSDMLTSAHYKAGYEAGRSRAPSPPETPAPHEKWCKAIDFTSEAKCDCGLPSRVAYVPRPAPETPATEGGALRWAAKMLNENNGTVRDDGLFVEVRVLKAHWESLRVEAQSAPASPASAPPRCRCCGHPPHDDRATCGHPEPTWEGRCCHCAGPAPASAPSRGTDHNPATKEQS